LVVLTIGIVAFATAIFILAHLPSRWGIERESLIGAQIATDITYKSVQFGHKTEPNCLYSSILPERWEKSPPKIEIDAVPIRLRLPRRRSEESE
jgi:hypothetical protein